MIANITLRLARRGDAQAIATLSRDLIERGLGWSWTARRVMRSIADADTNVLVALDAAGGLQGFGIMKYGDDDAHLLLLAVQQAQGRRGIGSALMAWLEAAALAAGVRRIFLEAREANAPARAFYRRLGYAEIGLLPGYYQGREDSVRLLKDLWEAAGKGVTPRAGDGVG
jgi:[ribosomal protein S18]-alanine N-acetyltransferase